MALKDVKKYYNEVCDQYEEMLQEIKEFEEECKNNLVEPEMLDTLKQTIQPLLINYQMISYVMFLLNKPTKKQKEEAYKKRNKKLLQSIESKYTKEGILNENQKVIDNLKNFNK